MSLGQIRVKDIQASNRAYRYEGYTVPHSLQEQVAVQC